MLTSEQVSLLKNSALNVKIDEDALQRVRKTSFYLGRLSKLRETLGNLSLSPLMDFTKDSMIPEIPQIPNRETFSELLKVKLTDYKYLKKVRVSEL